MPRRFEFSQGSSHKFYEVAVAGTYVEITFGRIGTAGQRQSKPFPDIAAARQHADRLIRQKLAKGYVERQPV